MALPAKALKSLKSTLSTELMYFLGIIACRHCDHSNRAIAAVVRERQDVGLLVSLLMMWLMEKLGKIHTCPLREKFTTYKIRD